MTHLTSKQIIFLFIGALVIFRIYQIFDKFIIKSYTAAKIEMVCRIETGVSRAKEVSAAGLEYGC